MDEIKRLKVKRTAAPLPIRRQVVGSHIRQRGKITLVDRRSTKGQQPVLALKAPRRKTLKSLYFPTLKSHFKKLRVLLPSHRKHPLITRVGWGLVAVVMVGTIFIELFNYRQADVSYHLSPEVEKLVGAPKPMLAQSLKLNAKEGVYLYNEGYKPSSGISGQVAGPKFTGRFNQDPKKGTTVTDPVNQVSVTFKPDYALAAPRQDQNRLVYPFKYKKAQKVYTLHATGLKEDIVLEAPQGDSMTFKYKLELPDGTEARMEPDGSLSIYGVSSMLLGNVTTGSEKDADLLKNARKSGEKNNLLFRFPAPFIRESSKKSSQAKAWFSLKENELTVHTSGLLKAKYPLSIDPTVYIETATKLMRGNNETNIDFDITNELIQKGETTGARFDTWDQTMALNINRWAAGTAVAGGYIYSVGGGRSDVTRFDVAGATTYVVPAGITSISIEAWGGGGGGGGSSDAFNGGAGGGGGYAAATITVTPGETLTIQVGGGGDGGSFVSDGGFEMGDGGAGGGYSGVLRSGTKLLIAGGGGGGGGGNGDSAGTPTAGSDGGAGGGTSGIAGSNNTDSTTGGGAGTNAAGGAAGVSATSGGTAGSSLQGGTGASLADTYNSATLGGGGAGGKALTDDTTSTNRRPGGGGGGGGNFGGGGGGRANGQGAGGGGGGGGSSLTTGTSTTNTAGSGATPGNSGDTDRNGSGTGGAAGAPSGGLPTAGSDGANGTVLITAASTASAATTSVYWSQFSTSNNTIQSPNPGDGTCSSWCTNSAYDLPAARIGLSLVAYNGYLYAIGGSDSSNNPQTTVYIAKIGANGEPQLWHPSGGSAVYWYSDTALSNARSYGAAVAYNNRLYILGGLSAASTVLNTNTVQYANMNPTGTLSSWTSTGMSALSTNRYGLAAQVYNDRIYVLGGATSVGGAPITTVQYAKLNNDGTMNSWVSTTSLTAGKMSWGGTFTTIYGGYIYMSGGCSAVNGSGYCTQAGVDGDLQLISINADGSLGDWNPVLGLINRRIGFGLVAWRGAIYGIGGCLGQNTGTGACTWTAAETDYGLINPDGDASTVSNSQPSGTAPCSGGSAYNCDVPPPGDGAGEAGQMSSSVVINNGFIYNIGGCADVSGTSECLSGDGTSGNTAYAALSSTGTIVAPASCSGTSYGTWCVDSSNVIYNPTATYNTGTLTQAGTTVTGSGTTWTTAHVGLTLRYNDGTTALITARSSNTSITVNVSKTIGSAQAYGFHTNGVAAASAAVFNNTIYVLGGTNGSNWSALAYRNAVNADGSLSGAWQNQTFNAIGMASSDAAGDDARGYMYVFTRANPSSAGSNPGNLYILGGCLGAATTSDGLGCQNYYTNVIKCNIATAGTLGGCTQTGQLQVDADADGGANGTQGIGLMAGTLYANYVYLVGGACEQAGAANDPCGSNFSGNRQHTMYAKIDNSNNIVDADGETSLDNTWTLATGLMSPVRRRAISFGYNGFIYSLAGYSGASSLQDLLFAKIDVSTGDIGSFDSSGVVVTPRWDLRAIVSNGYVYAIGGCGYGSAPAGCTDMQEEVQTFQLYNNDSGAVASYSTTSTCGTGPCLTGTVDRIGASATIMNGYIYYVGGCTNIGCTTMTNTNYYAPINADGTIGSWSQSASNLPASLAWGKLVNTGGTLYYIGGQTGSATTTAVSTVYYTSSISSGAPTWNGSAASGGIGDTASQAAQARTQMGAAVWNNRIYVVGGYSSGGTVQSSVYISPQLASGGNISVDTWTSDADTINVARAGMATVAYANNLYIFGGFDNTNYLNDSQFTQINSDGTIDAWTYSTSLPSGLRDAEAFAANGYLYVIGGRTAASTCVPNTLITPISANTTIASGNNPTGIGEWYETNQKYTGDRYGAALAYYDGRAYLIGGGCSSFVAAANRTYNATLKSQPQVAKYSRMIDTDTDVFPTKWLLNGLDNSTGAEWYMRYRSMTNPLNVSNPCITPAMTTWGQETNYGKVTLGTTAPYIPKDGSGTNTNCARYFYMGLTIDSSQAFGYPEDVNRGPTIWDLSLFFTSDPSKRLIHGKTFTSGEQQPLDTPCNATNPNCQ